MKKFTRTIENFTCAHCSEEVVGNPRSSTQFRKPVESLAERNDMQRMLESIRDSLQAHPPRP